MYHAVFAEFAKQLRLIDTWFDKATAIAKAKSFEPNLFATFRLAPDQFPLARQVMIACDTAKLGASRLTGKDAPAHEDTQTTLDELRARVHSVVAFLGTLTEADFSATATRTISQPRWEGKTMSGANYFVEHVVPNFYFHLAHVYAILRHNGVDVGKRDYLGQLTFNAS